MNLKKISNKIISISTSFLSYLIPLFQYVPCTSIWFGIMSIPLITYIIAFFQTPNILIYDFLFFFGSLGSYVAICGFIFYVYTLTFQIIHRKQLIKEGPYRFVRHPQYLAIIVLTFGMTLIVFQTSPIFTFNIYNKNPYSILLLIWIGEVLSYIILAKIEEFALHKKYGEEFLQYKKTAGFLFPNIKFKNKEFYN